MIEPEPAIPGFREFFDDIASKTRVILSRIYAVERSPVGGELGRTKIAGSFDAGVLFLPLGKLPSGTGRLPVPPEALPGGRVI